jgi:poly-gamma-glutamate synthesis protein (capsule biosynthesis protein)
MGEVTLMAVGDVVVAREDPDRNFDLVRPALRAADICFGQLEAPLSNAGTPQRAGGPPAAGPPRDPVQGARALQRAGFTVMSFAGNKTMGLSELSMLETMRAVAEHTDIRLVGAGATVGEARRPAIVEVNGTRVGFLAYCSVLPLGAWAQDRELPDGTVQHRAGVAPLRAHTSYEDVDWQPGCPPRIVTLTNSDDLAAMTGDIAALRPRVDTVVVSMHWGVHFEPGTIAMYQVEAGHAAIDAGADLILGHHPHKIKGIEFYRDRPILYAMNNFSWTVRGRNGELVEPGRTDDAQKTFMARIVITDGVISRLSLIPCLVENERLQPEPVPRSDPRSMEILRYLEWVCANNTPEFPPTSKARRAFPPFTTRFSFDGDEIVVCP